MARTDDTHQERERAHRTGFRRAASARAPAWAARRGIRRSGPAVRRPPRGEVSPRRELVEFLEVVYETLPSPAALAYLGELDPAEREAALFEYAAHLGDQGIVPPIVHHRVTRLRQYIASLA